MNVDALKSFIISQGASRRIITMEWDKFWSENKKILEERSPRYMGVDEKDLVVFTITNVPAEIVSTSVQIHPQKPENGTRVMRRFNKLFIDQLDALTFSEGEEVTFIRWGNFFIEKIEKNSEGKVISMSGRYLPDATNFSKTKKTTWLAAIPDVVPLKIFEFDQVVLARIREADDVTVELRRTTDKFVTVMSTVVPGEINNIIHADLVDKIQMSQEQYKDILSITSALIIDEQKWIINAIRLTQIEFFQFIRRKNETITVLNL
jgi:glutamyl-tRNA synthetase